MLCQVYGIFPTNSIANVLLLILLFENIIKLNFENKIILSVYLKRY